MVGDFEVEIFYCVLFVVVVFVDVFENYFGYDVYFFVVFVFFCE